MPNPGLSVWFSLDYAARLQPGQNVLVLGATGVTGSLAVQLAKAQLGAGRVVVAGRNAARLDWLCTVGAGHAIPLGAGDLTKTIASEHNSHPLDVVLDYLWGAPAEQMLAGLANNRLTTDYHATRCVQVGSMAGATISLPANVLRSAGIELLGPGIGSVPAKAQARRKGASASALQTGRRGLGADRHPFPSAQRCRASVDRRRVSRDMKNCRQAEPSVTRIVLVP